MIVNVYLRERQIAALPVAVQSSDTPNYESTCILLAKGILRIEGQPEADIEAANYVVRERLT